MIKLSDDDPTLNSGMVAAIFQGIRTCIARKPYIFVIFQGGGGVWIPCPPSRSAHAIDVPRLLSNDILVFQLQNIGLNIFY